VAIVAVAGQDSEVGRNEAVPLWAAIAEVLAPDPRARDLSTEPFTGRAIKASRSRS
jgi:hypothetical protein